MKQELHDIVVETVKAAPPITVSAVTMNHVAIACTIVYTLLQIAFLIRKWVRDETAWGIRFKRWKDGEFTKPGDLE